jgi:hypothetical protein
VPVDWTISALGFVVGLLVGCTGIGAAALMTPLLILVGGVRPLIAVGTDLAYGAITKAVGGSVHYRQQTVDAAIARQLALGSIPMALVGVGCIRWMTGGTRIEVVDHFVSQALGLALILVALSLLLRPWPRCGSAPPTPSGHSGRQRMLTVILGAGIGFLVGLTSVGSGSLIAAALLTVYPRLPLRRVVGTDIFHAAFLTAAAGLAHLGLGHVDLLLLGQLLIGSIPGVWLGSRLAVALPERLLRPVLACLLLGVGFKLM